jgi:hypothetical protein
MILVVEVELTVFGGEAFVVTLAPVGEETTAVVLVIDEPAVEIGLVVGVEDVEVDIILRYCSCVASMMLKEGALSFGCGCIDSEEHEIKLVIEEQAELGAPIAAVDRYFPHV